MAAKGETSSGAPVDLEQGDQQVRCVLARYGRIGNIGLFAHDIEPPPAPGSMIVVRSERGAELARVLIHVGPEPGSWRISGDSLDKYLAASGPDYPITREGRILRVATAQDFNDQQHLDNAAKEEASFCREQIRKIGLEMKLIWVEHLLGGERIVFYFIADQRVDFRGLVRQLAGRYHTRIEMRQVGARDEARLLGDYERCGRQCCCQEYLKLLKPVSMRMAKTQKATLDPTKISGRCGRLMCCLRYEDETYERLQAKLPKKNTYVRTADGVVGKVLDSQILTQLVRLALPNQGQAVVANEEIVERDLPEAPPPEPPAAPRARPPPRRREPVRARSERPPASEEPGDGTEPPAPSESAARARPPAGEAATPRRGGRRRGRKKRRQHPEALSAPPQSSSQPTGQASSQAQGPKGSAGKKRRRRRRRKPGGE